MFIPSWVFEVAVMRTASEYLSSEMGIEAFGKKYSDGLKTIYTETLAPEVFVETARKQMARGLKVILPKMKFRAAEND